MSDNRRDPEAFLTRLRQEEQKSKRGRLKIFFGANAGVGKTYTMLEAAQKLREQNIDLAVGYVETHGRKETEALLDGLEILPVLQTEYRGTTLSEFDIDAALARHPEIILVDELAHTNVPGSRNNKRWQDVQELLEAGIDVYTTLNVQHVETMHDVVAQITRVSIKERVPDSMLENAAEIELVDLPPEELLQRLREGKVYMSTQARAAMDNFFRKGNLIALRELALRYTAERVNADMEEYRSAHEIQHPWPASERIVVCISSSPMSPRLVRAGKRLAEALRAKWTVMYVEGASQIALSDADRNRVTQTLRLAEQLGAETLELSGREISEEIIKCATQANATKIIIGKPAKPRWKELLFGSIVDDVIRKSGAIDVYVLTGEENDSLSDQASRFAPKSSANNYMWAFAIVCICSVITRAMHVHFEISNLAMVYLFGVVMTAVWFGRGPSILASLLSVIAFDFLCVPPYYTFAVSDTQYVVTFGVMFVVGVLISTLTATIRQQADAARIRETRTAALYSLSRELSSTLDTRGVVSAALRHIAQVFNCQAAVFLGKSDATVALISKGTSPHELSNADSGIAAWVFRNRQPAGFGTDTLPGTKELYVPLLGAQSTLGVLAVRPAQQDRALSPDQLHLLETFANQLAGACERSQLSEETEQARLLVKTEQLRNSLLSSISHDLRTPLATIAGAASGIVSGTDSLDITNCKEMAQEIYDESLRLNRLVGNLLDMTKLQSGTLVIGTEPHPVDELVGAALSCVEDRAVQHVIKTDIPVSLPFVSVDPILIQQVLLNLIENALKYTPPGSTIELVARQADKDTVILGIADNGPGIRDELKSRIFEKFYREDSSSASGAGLGLAICRGIMEAHGGKIWVEDRPGGGAAFKFTLAIDANLQEHEDEDAFAEFHDVNE